MKQNKFKNIIALIYGIFSSIISLILMIKSFEKYDDGYGIDYSIDSNYIIALIVSVGIIIYTILSINNLKKANDNSKNTTITVFTLSTIVSFYTLGVFFKGLFKAISKNISFTYATYQAYLYIGIAFLLFLISQIPSLITIIKEK